MPYEITTSDTHHEIRVFGETSKTEILEIIQSIAQRDPLKTLPDLWCVAAESQIPFFHFADIAQTIQRWLPPNVVRNRTAIVAADDFHKALLELYRAEASILPYDMRVFRDRDEALEWIKAGPASRT